MDKYCKYKVIFDTDQPIHFVNVSKQKERNSLKGNVGGIAGLKANDFHDVARLCLLPAQLSKPHVCHPIENLSAEHQHESHTGEIALFYVHFPA